MGLQVQYIQADEECLPLRDGSVDGETVACSPVFRVLAVPREKLHQRLAANCVFNDVVARCLSCLAFTCSRDLPAGAPLDQRFAGETKQA